MRKKKQQEKESGARYVRRLAGSEYIQNQLGQAVEALAKAYRRVARGGGQAVEDKKFYGNVRDAVTSLRNALRALQRRQPEPEPKRRGRKLFMLTAAGVGTAVLAIRLRRTKNSPDVSASGTSNVGEVAPTADGSFGSTGVQVPAGGSIEDPEGPRGPAGQ